MERPAYVRDYRVNGQMSVFMRADSLILIRAG
jgi:hypothetical protein